MRDVLAELNRYSGPYIKQVDRLLVQGLLSQ